MSVETDRDHNEPLPQDDPKFGAKPADQRESLPVDADFGPEDAQLPFHDGPSLPEGAAGQTDIVPVAARKPVTETPAGAGGKDAEVHAKDEK